MWLYMGQKVEQMTFEHFASTTNKREGDAVFIIFLIICGISAIAAYVSSTITSSYKVQAYNTCQQINQQIIQKWNGEAPVPGLVTCTKRW